MANPLFKHAGKRLIQSRAWRTRLYRLMPQAMDKNGPNERANWKLLDPIYARTRRQVEANPSWRYGPKHVYDSARWAYDNLTKYISLPGKSYCELGCGKHHPYGTSAVMYINGLENLVATDILVPDEQRAAEALYDLLLDCLARPQKWLWTDIAQSDYLSRIHHFDLDALQAGDLRAGTRGLPIRHIITDINSPDIEPESIDLMSSRAVLEHFLDFQRATANLYVIMKPGGTAYHYVDLVDHRVYRVTPQHHYWSFLADKNFNGDTNRLRANEVLNTLQTAGFEILDCEREDAEMPEGFRAQLLDHYAAMSDAQLSTIRIGCAIRKPGG